MMTATEKAIVRTRNSGDGYPVIRCSTTMMLASGCVAVFVAACLVQTDGVAAEVTNSVPDETVVIVPNEGSEQLAAATNETVSVPPSPMDAFKVIAERNIFNANRVPPSARRAPPPRPAPRVDSFSLVGTMFSEDGGRYAFFEGTESSFNKVLEEGGTISGYTALDFRLDSVTLQAADGIKVELPTQMQMKREENGPWQVVVGTSSSSGRMERSSSSSSRSERGSFSSNSRSERGSSSSRRDRGGRQPSFDRTERSSPTESRPSSSGSGEENADSAESAADILKKLMEQRAREQNQ